MARYATKSIVLVSLLMMQACNDDPVVGSWNGMKQHLAFSSDGTLLSLEATATSEASTTRCEAAGFTQTIETCDSGDWQYDGNGYQLKTSQLMVFDGGNRINCSCSYSTMYAEIADARLVLYEERGGTTIDTLRR